MVARPAAALIACLAAACGPPAATSTPAGTATGAPRGAAVIVHEEAGDRLYAIDLAGGAPRTVGPSGAGHPVWSPDGRYLAYLVGDRLWLHADGEGDTAVADGIDDQAQRPCAFRPGGRELAVALPGAVAEVIIGTPGAPKQVAARADRRVADLLWSPDGSVLVILFWAPSTPAVAEVVRVAGGTATSQAADGVTHLLGWRPSGELVAVRADEGGEHPVALAASGASLLRPAGEHLFVLDYARSPDLLLLGEGGEDPGDDARILVAAPGPARPVRWLSRHPRLSDLHLSQDGRSAVFIDRSPGSGGVYVVGSIAAEQTQLVLPAATTRSFSSPVLRP